MKPKDEQEETKEMTKLGVECQGNHENMKKEMEKTGSSEKKCPYCGKEIKCLNR